MRQDTSVDVDVGVFPTTRQEAVAMVALPGGGGGGGGEMSGMVKTVFCFLFFL